MITFLLIIIAALLFVLASKIAPEELNSLWILCIVAGVAFLIFQYGIYLLALGYYLVVNGKALLYTLSDQPVFQILVLGSLAGYWIWYMYAHRTKIITNVKTEFKPALKQFFKLFGIATCLFIGALVITVLFAYFFIK